VLGSGRRRVLSLALGGALALAAEAVLDIRTWGVPFAPFWRTFAFNVVEDGAKRWGESPWWTYLAWVVRVDGPLLALLLVVGLLLACRRPPGTSGREREVLVPVVLVAGIAAFVAVLSAIGHKELRFLVPAMPLAGALAAVGLARWLPVALAALARRVGAVAPRPGLAVGALSAAAAAACMLVLPGLTIGDLGYLWPRASAWRGDDAAPRLLGEVGRLPDVCGVMVLSEGISWSGGFTALHRDVPLAAKRGARDVGSARAWANVVITLAARPLPTGYRPVAVEGNQVAAQRSGSCAPPPASVARRWI
jgi:hypothetical protein